MDSQWFYALFKKNYDIVMNHVFDYVNYGNGTSNDGSVSDDKNIDDACHDAHDVKQ